jgi:hypothetical protein
VANQHDLSHEARMEAAANGEALPDGSYPTRDRAELQAAIESYGRETGNKNELRRYLIRRAVALNATDLIPDDWEVEIEHGGQDRK